MVNDVQAEIPQSDRSGRVDWPAPLRRGHWVDDHGVTWQRRGDPLTRLSDKRVKQLVRSPKVRVRIFYGPYEERDIPAGEREAFWEEIGPHSEVRTGIDAGDRTSYAIGEFSNAAGDKLVVVEKSC